MKPQLAPFSRGRLAWEGERRVILDCDPGIHDALALLLTCASMEIDLLAVTAVAGTSPVETTSMNACRLLDLAGRQDIPVHAGCARPLTASNVLCKTLAHGPDGLGGLKLPTVRSPATVHAIDCLIDSLSNEPADSITLIATGPLTNLAMAEFKRPGLLRRARSLLVVGGAVCHPGSVTTDVEFNCHADPLATHTVLNSGVEMTMFPRDIASTTVLRPEWIASFGDMQSPCAAAVCSMLRALSAPQLLLHDICAVAYLLKPSLFAGEPCSVAIETRCQVPMRGQTHVRRASSGDAPFAANATVCSAVNGDRLLELVSERIRMLP